MLAHNLASEIDSRLDEYMLPLEVAHIIAEEIQRALVEIIDEYEVNENAD